MADFSNATESAIVQHITGEAVWTPPAGMFLQLHSGDPGEDGTANVETDFGARQDVTFGPESGGVAASTTQHEFVNGGVGSITVTHVSYHDAVTAGACVYKGAVTTPKAVAAGDTARFLAGQLTIGAE